MDNRSREELIVWLTQIIDNELKKPDDQTDMDLILECSDYLDELQKEKNFYNERDIQTKIDIIKRRVQNSITEEKPTVVIRTRHKMPLYKKILVAVAAALLLAVSALTVVARVQNYHSTLDFIKDHIRQIKNMSSHDTLVGNDTTVLKSSKTTWYESLDELLAAEKADMLYPADVAIRNEIKKIYKSEFQDGSYRITVAFNNVNDQIIIDSSCLSDYSNWNNAEIYIYAGVTFNLLPRKEIYQASCQYNGYEYTITSDTRDSLIEIIQNLKEYKP